MIIYLYNNVSVFMNNSNSNPCEFCSHLRSAYKYCRLVRLPMNDKKDPLNWLLYSRLFNIHALRIVNIYEEIKVQFEFVWILFLKGLGSTYISCKLERLPMDVGIDPLSWLLLMYLIQATKSWGYLW